MPVSSNHPSYLPVISPGESKFRHQSNFKGSHDVSAKYSCPSCRYSVYSRINSLPADLHCSCTPSSYSREKCCGKQNSSTSKYSAKVPVQHNVIRDLPAVKSSQPSVHPRNVASSRYLSDLNGVSVADIQLRLSSLLKKDDVQHSRVSESYTHAKSKPLQPVALPARKKAIVATPFKQSSMKLVPSGSSLEEKESYSFKPMNFSSTAVPHSRGLNGLRNIGNTCFLNSIVQCLSHTYQLKEYLVSGNYLSEINPELNGSLIRSFANLITELWQGENKIIGTNVFKNQIQTFAPQFIGFNQQDAQEFLRCLLEGLHEDVNKIKPKFKVKPKPVNDELSEPQKAAECWKSYLRCDNSRIVDIFAGQLKSTLKCTYCNNASTTYEVFWDLSLPFPSTTRNLQLAQCLKFFTKNETLDGDEQPVCSNCKVRRKCTKAFTIQKLPAVLVLHLNRFSPDYFRKLLVMVDFPLTNLDMSPYMDVQAKPDRTIYKLYAVSNHIGNMHSGHYTAYCRCPDNDTWYHFNDSIVSPVTTDQVVSSEAYILFYTQNRQNY